MSPSSRKPPNRRRPRRTPRTSVSTVVAFPQRPFAWGQRRCTLNYSAQFALDAGVGLSVSKVFVANGLYDPEYSIGGHQPYSFDEIMALYNHYTVLAARIEARPNAPGGDVNVAYGVTVSGSADDLNGFTTQNVIEHPGTREFKTLSRYGTQQPVRASVQLPRFFGASNIVGKEPYAGTASANPIEQAFFNVWAGGLGTGDPAATTFVVKIVFDVVFSEARTLVSS